jgi:hypothetical protein
MCLIPHVMVEYSLTVLSCRIAFWFAESDPFSCYLMADFENLNVQTILNYLLKNTGMPPIADQLLQGCNVILNKLAIKVAAKEVYNPRLNETIPQGIYFESNIFFKGKSLYALRFKRF